MAEQDDYETARWFSYSFGIYPFDADWMATRSLYLFRCS